MLIIQALQAGFKVLTTSAKRTVDLAWAVDYLKPEIRLTVNNFGKRGDWEMGRKPPIECPGQPWKKAF